MEFFAFADIVTTEAEIRAKIAIDTLPLYCSAIEGVDEAETLGRVIYFLHWGRFHVREEAVMGGVRFSVPDCPNALAWTITTGYPPEPNKIVLHATINRTEHGAEFLEATRDLLASFKEGLEQNYTRGTATAAPRPITFTDLRGMP